MDPLFKSSQRLDGMPSISRHVSHHPRTRLVTRSYESKRQQTQNWRIITKGKCALIWATAGLAPA